MSALEWEMMGIVCLTYLIGLGVGYLMGWARSLQS